MEKNIIKIKSDDLLKILLPHLSKSEEVVEEKVPETIAVEFSDEERNMLLDILSLVEGDDENEIAILDSVLEKLNNIEQK